MNIPPSLVPGSPRRGPPPEPAHRVLLALHAAATADGCVRLHPLGLAEQTGLRLADVHRHLQELHQAGLVEHPAGFGLVYVTPAGMRLAERLGGPG